MNSENCRDMKQSDWINAEVKPQDNEDVLVLDDRHGMLIACYDSYWEMWSSCEYGQLDYVTHWQPIELPQNAR